MPMRSRIGVWGGQAWFGRQPNEFLLEWTASAMHSRFESLQIVCEGKHAIEQDLMFNSG